MPKWFCHAIAEDLYVAGLDVFSKSGGSGEYGL
jgi:hypothetical protein